MENLIERENELRKLAESGDYWNILELADFLSDQKRYEEAEEWYLEIAGEDDLFGDANAHYSHMLLDTEDYDEAVKYYLYVLNCSDTSPREGICVRFKGMLEDGKSPIWEKIDEYYFELLIRIHKDNLEKHIEGILLTRLESNSEDIRKISKKRLLTLYYSGKFRTDNTLSFDWCDHIEIPNAIDLEKANRIANGYMIIEDGCLEKYFGIDENVVIPDGVITLGVQCFADNSTIKTVTIPASVEIIEKFAFTKCSSLIEVIFEQDSQLRTLGDESFAGCTALKSFFVPKNVDSIPSGCFSDCTSLEMVTFESEPMEWLVYIGLGAFQGCTSLKRVDCVGVCCIESFAFAYCESLTEVFISEASDDFEICDRAFLGSEKVVLTGDSNVVENAKKQGIAYNKFFIEDGKLFSCFSDEKDIIIPTGVRKIYIVFDYNETIETVVIPSTVEEICGGCFEGCENLTIYCEAEEKPNGWDDDWNPDNRPVVWGYKK